jgi:hypothetical protein
LPAFRAEQPFYGLPKAGFPFTIAVSKKFKIKWGGAVSPLQLFSDYLRLNSKPDSDRGPLKAAG